MESGDQPVQEPDPDEALAEAQKNYDEISSSKIFTAMEEMTRRMTSQVESLDSEFAKTQKMIESSIHFIEEKFRDISETDGENVKKDVNEENDSNGRSGNECSPSFLDRMKDEEVEEEDVFIFHHGTGEQLAFLRPSSKQLMLHLRAVESLESSLQMWSSMKRYGSLTNLLLMDKILAFNLNSSKIKRKHLMELVNT